MPMLPQSQSQHLHKMCRLTLESNHGFWSKWSRWRGESDTSLLGYVDVECGKVGKWEGRVDPSVGFMVTLV